jgi:hypothetical protein
MTANFRHAAAPLINTIQKLFSEDLAKENDFLRQENKILRSKLGIDAEMSKDLENMLTGKVLQPLNLIRGTQEQEADL